MLLHRTKILLCTCALALAQQERPLRNQQDTPGPTFQSKVNLVLVPVVVRDRRGHAIGNLTQSDFELLDNGKPQSVTTFSPIRHSSSAPDEKNVAAAAHSQTATASATGNNPTGAGSGRPGSRPARNFIYLFDDLNIRFADLARVREAAAGHFQRSFSDGDRAAIYTVTGRNSLEFTSDREQLETAVTRLRWGTVAGRGGMTCPDVSYYIADLIITKADSLALDGLTIHTVECAHARPEVARQIALAAANREMIFGREDTKLMLSTLRRAIRRLSGLPGERVIVLASPGFFAQTPEAVKATADVLDLAARNQVIIHGLSVRGVMQAEEEEDVTRRVAISRRVPPSASSPDQLWIHYRRESARADGDVMKDLAEGTGGAFFHNSNDLRAGFEQLAGAPEFSYMLGFSPAEFKADGRFHRLKVLVPAGKGATVEARRGYYAVAPEAQAPQTAELEDAVFSRNERSEIPVVLQIGYSKPNHADAVKVYVLARIEVGPLRFQKTDGRNRDSLDIVVALFDSDGAYVTDTAETEHLSFDDEALGKKDPTVTLRWDFPGVKPGDYVARFVIREQKTGATTIINRTLKVL
jgi:VWFA-related protein